MKTLLISLICTCASMSLFAQADSTNTMNNGTYNDNNNSTYTDTSGTMNNNPTYTDTSGKMNNNMNSDMNSTDTSAYMNNANNSVNNATGSNTWNNSMQNTTAMASDKAALPVLETYVPQDIVDQAKRKYSNGQIYDITAVRSPEGTMAQNTGMNASTDNSAMEQSQNTNLTTDQNSAMTSTNNTATNNTVVNSNSRNSSMNQDTTTMNSHNNNNNTTQTTATRIPKKYDYVVRVLQRGTMQTQTLTSNGTALVQRTFTHGQVTEQ